MCASMYAIMGAAVCDAMCAAVCTVPVAAVCAVPDAAVCILLCCLCALHQRRLPLPAAPRK